MSILDFFKLNSQIRKNESSDNKKSISNNRDVISNSSNDLKKPQKKEAVLREIFVGMAGTSSSGSKIRNDGEFGYDMDVAPVGILSYYEFTDEHGTQKVSNAI